MGSGIRRRGVPWKPALRNPGCTIFNWSAYPVSSATRVFQRLRVHGNRTLSYAYEKGNFTYAFKAFTSSFAGLNVKSPTHRNGCTPPPSEITGPADPVFDLAQLDLPSSPNMTPESDPGPILFTSDDSEETINFPLATPQGSDVSLAEDGRLLIKTSDTVVGSFEQAWALDASGDFLESSYEYVDGSIRQTVTFDENTEFPVLMDPTRELDTQAET